MANTNKQTLSERSQQKLNSIKKNLSEMTKCLETLNTIYIDIREDEYNNNVKFWDILLDIFKYSLTIFIGFLGSTILFKQLADKTIVMLIFSIVIAIVLIVLVIVRFVIIKTKYQKVFEAKSNRFSMEKIKLEGLINQIDDDYKVIKKS